MTKRPIVSVTAVRGWVALCLLITVAGCSWMNAWRSEETASGGGEEKAPTQLYYDFGDILVPADLELNRKSSFIFKTPDMVSGVMALSGRVEVTSLITFFETHMAQDNWEQVSSFKSVRTIMLYRKANRWCVINISESSFTTEVEIWVAPTAATTAGSDGGLLKEPSGS